MHRNARTRTGFAVGWWRWLMAAVAIGALVGAACGGEEEEAQETPQASPQATQPAGRTPAAGGALKIGFLAPFTGDLSDFGPAFFNAAKLAVKEINEAGGVNGQPIELVQADDGTNPEQAVQEARRLIEVEGVSAIIGPASSGATIQVAESVTGPNRILEITPSATSPALSTVNDNDYLFRTPISDAAQGKILADLANEQGFTSACVMYTNDAYGQGLSQAFAEAFQALGGTVTAQVPHEREQASYASELQQCTQGNPDVLVAVSFPESAGVYLREAVEQNLVENFLFVDGTKSGDMFAQLGWEHFEGMFGTEPGALDTEAGKAFDERYQAEYGEVPALPFLRQSYDAVYAIALAAQKAGSNDSTAIRDALREVTSAPGVKIMPGVDGWKAALEALANGQDVDLDGTSSNLEFDENGDIVQGAIQVWKIEGGQIVAVETRPVNLAE
ncbi:MAG TPA: ABC transporter substrate-binding protein [Dehalococcoidia bacterium]|nr:ABC transporter substrate-binding protein [Dehalococcoidia bacterium]